jgi:hypothetical protein
MEKNSKGEIKLRDWNVRYWSGFGNSEEETCSMAD